MSHSLPAALTRKPPVALSEKLVWSVFETSQATGLSDRTIFKAISAGELRCIRSGRRVLLDPVEVRRWLGLSTPK